MTIDLTKNAIVFGELELLGTYSQTSNWAIRTNDSAPRDYNKVFKGRNDNEIGTLR